MKPWAYVAGKVRIGEAWEDPTLDRPILRALPRNWSLTLSEEPELHLNELADKCVGLISWLIGLTILGQLFGCFGG